MMHFPKKIFLIVTSIILSCCFAEEMESMKREAERLGKEGNQQILSILEDLFQNNSALLSQDDLLLEGDKGKYFNEKDIVMTPFEKELEKVVKESVNKEQFEGTEEFFSGATSVLKEPESHVGIESYETSVVPSAELFEQCVEEGSFEGFVIQRRTIKVTPAIEKMQTWCLGHEETKEFFWKSNAESQQTKWEKELTQDGTIRFHHVWIDRGGVFENYRIIRKWSHKDGYRCTASKSEKKIVQERKEEDIWEAEDPTFLHYLEENPKCHLLLSQQIDGSGVQTIDGKHVFRDFWTRGLFFSCNGDESSKCQMLREQGGMIVAKKCLKQTPYKECALWEKQYKMGGQTAFVKREVQYREEPIWGIGEFEPTAPLENDFGDAISKLSAISDLKETEDLHQDILKAGVFKGDSLKCKRSFAENILYDCCGSLAGFATDIGLAGCSSEEKDLYKRKREGKCHYIGKRSSKMGFEKEWVYCCFPTQLSRIIQEEGRKQLHIEWGSAEQPHCQGLSLEQIKGLDFDAMDFSDFILEVQQKIDQETLRKKLKNHAQNFSYTSGETATKALLNKEPFHE